MNKQKQSNELKTLNTLRKGDVAVITGLIESNNNNSDNTKRLLELGFVPGETVKVIAESFPQHDPFVIKIGNSSFALRRHETMMIEVICK
jgi:ferrous iron transport protein A